MTDIKPLPLPESQRLFVTQAQFDAFVRAGIRPDTFIVKGPIPVNRNAKIFTTIYGERSNADKIRRAPHRFGR
jgi:hypothetical protein